MEINSAESHDLPAVRRKPLKEEIYDVLHEHILAGEYPAGSWLRQEEISSKLGVSMTPVREALDLLVSAGLAERVPFRGVRIQSPSDTAILTSYAMRLLLETAATYAAAININCEQLSDLLQMLEKGKVLVGRDQHAFNNDTNEARYDRAAAELAWERTIGFFKETLTF